MAQMMKKTQEAALSVVVALLAAVFATRATSGEDKVVPETIIKAEQQRGVADPGKMSVPPAMSNIYHRYAEKEARRQEEVMNRAHLDLERMWADAYRRHWQRSFPYSAYAMPRHYPGPGPYFGYPHISGYFPYRWYR